MKYAAIILAGVCLWLLLNPPAVTAPAARDGWRTEFAHQLLATLRAPETPDMVEFVVQWTLSEDGTDGAYTRGNPLNTTLCTGGDTGRCLDGVAATAATLTEGPYDELVAAIRAGDAGRARSALWDSPWAAGHYGWGREWAR
jgi:hypothetical protein